MIERAKKYYREHVTQKSEYNRNYRLANIEKERENDKNRDKEKARSYAKARRARKFGAGGKLTAKEWQEIQKKYGNKCLCCGSTEKITIDHVIPISKGGLHVKSNIQPLCNICNSKKHTKETDYRNGKIYA